MFSDVILTAVHRECCLCSTLRVLQFHERQVWVRATLETEGFEVMCSKFSLVPTIPQFCLVYSQDPDVVNSKNMSQEFRSGHPWLSPLAIVTGSLCVSARTAVHWTPHKALVVRDKRGTLCFPEKWEGVFLLLLMATSHTGSLMTSPS